MCDSRVSENNYNVGVVFNHVKAHCVKYYLAADIAMHMKFFGKQQCSSKHPCYLCPAPDDDLLNPDETLYPLTTSESAQNDFENWMIYSGDREDLKLFHNQEFLPVGIEHMNERELKEPIMLKAPPPPLHLLLSTNTLTKVLEDVWEEGIKEWMRLALQSYRNYFGKTLEGNQCSALISKYDILERVAENHARPDIAVFVTAFKNLNAVKNACFGLKLDENFEEIIDDFRDALVALGEMHDVNITPKFHIICIHVKQYCKMTNMSLRVNEQSLEASHKKFTKLLLRFGGLNPDTENPLYPLNVLRAFEVLNSDATFRDSL